MSTSAAIRLLFSLVPIGSFAQGTIELYSDHDAVIGYHYGLSSENTNYDAADWFGALSQAGSAGGENNSRALIYFDLTGILPGTMIDDATLDLYGIGAVGLGDAAAAGSIGENVCVLEQIIQAWSDSTVTWTTQPGITQQNQVLLPQSTQPIEDYIGINVTTMVQAMINSPWQAHGFSLRLQTEDPTRGLFFCGNGYSDPAKRPRLRIKPNGSVAVPEPTIPAEFHLSPNPVTSDGMARLEIPELAIGGRVWITDLSGRSVFDLPINGQLGQRLMITPPDVGRFVVNISNRAGEILVSGELVVVRP